MADEVRRNKRRLEDMGPSMNRFGAGMMANRNARGGGVLGGIMGFAGLNGVRRNAYNFYGNGGGMGGSFAFNGGGGGGGGGGNDPNDPNDPNNPGLPGDKFGKNLIPQWWKDWYLAEGQYGGVPPVDGLL